VRDPDSGRTGATRVLIDVPDFDARRSVVSSPLFMADPHERLVLPTASRAKPQLEIPFRVGDKAFTVEARPRLRTPAPTAVCVMLWSGDPGKLDALPDIQARLTGVSVELPLRFSQQPRLTNDPDGWRRVELSVDAGDAPAGDYQLEIRLTLGDGETVSSLREVRVD